MATLEEGSNERKGQDVAMKKGVVMPTKINFVVAAWVTDDEDYSDPDLNMLPIGTGVNLVPK